MEVESVWASNICTKRVACGFHDRHVSEASTDMKSALLPAYLQTGRGDLARGRSFPRSMANLHSHFLESDSSLALKVRNSHAVQTVSNIFLRSSSKMAELGLAVVATIDLCIKLRILTLPGSL